MAGFYCIIKRRVLAYADHILFETASLMLLFPYLSRDLLQKVSKVSIDDMQRVSKKYFKKLFDPLASCSALCCHPSKVEEILKDFSR